MLKGNLQFVYIKDHVTASMVEWSEFLATDPEVRV
jgi:hypothetical protein